MDLLKPFVLLFIWFHYKLNTHLSLRIKGLGIIQRFLNKAFIFEALGAKYFYKPSIEGSYDYLLIGKSNEPETHLFFNRVSPQLKSFCFIDIGASIGEFVNTISTMKNAENIYAFEPRPDCAEVLRKNVTLNNKLNVQIFENAVGNGNGSIELFMNPGGTSSGLYSLSEKRGKEKRKQPPTLVQIIRIDDVIQNKLENTVILIDIEGAEPLALEGAKEFIRRNEPLIVFEYNNTSKQHFNLKDIQKIIGNHYSIFRIKADGSLDVDFSNSWNCVAIPKQTIFEEILLN